MLQGNYRLKKIYWNVVLIQDPRLDEFSQSKPEDQLNEGLTVKETQKASKRSLCNYWLPLGEIIVLPKTLVPPGLAPGTFRVLSERDNHYTMELCKIQNICWSGCVPTFYKPILVVMYVR